MLKCYILTPFGGKPLSFEYQVSMQRMLAYFYSHQIPGTDSQAINYKVVEGANIAQNRDWLAHEAMKDPQMTHMLWVDSDMEFPHDMLHRLLLHNVDIVGANYPTRNQDVHSRKFTASGDGESADYQCITNDSVSGLERVSYMGFGALLTSRRVFEETFLNTKEPIWFFMGFDEKTFQHIGEDWIFCARVTAAGFYIYVDHDLSKEIGHVGSYVYTYKDM
jgi:hypothetical protein